jgi:hypothetical protein
LEALIFFAHQASEADALASAKQTPTQGDASASLNRGFAKTEDKSISFVLGLARPSPSAQAMHSDSLAL